MGPRGPRQASKKAESRKQKAESRKQKAESRKQKALALNGKQWLAAVGNKRQVAGGYKDI
jgi:hypothetical protein